MPGFFFARQWLAERVFWFAGKTRKACVQRVAVTVA
jgi:hypothetical protein